MLITFFYSTLNQMVDNQCRPPFVAFLIVMRMNLISFVRSTTDLSIFSQYSIIPITLDLISLSSYFDFTDRDISFTYIPHIFPPTNR